jgi:hypothetical protein
MAYSISEQLERIPAQIVRKTRRGLFKGIGKLLDRRARRKLQGHKQVWEYLEGVVSPSTGCSYSVYWALYSTVLREKPKELLELGSGITTGVIGHAIKQNGFGRLVSMEESEYYAAAAGRILPPEMRAFVEIVQSLSVEKRHSLFAGVGYKDIPDRRYDFVFVDGPYYDRESSYDVDLIEIVSKADQPVTAVVDSRVGSCLVYGLLLRSKFAFDYTRKIGCLSRATKADLASYRDVISRALSGGSQSMRRTILW